MSLRDKAREVKEAGVAERGNSAPHGVPKRIYQWWLAESDSKKARAIRYGDRKENFCHFWRVVLFWAPLRKTVYAIDEYVLNEYVGTAVAALIVLFALFLIFTHFMFFLACLGVLTVAVLLGTGALAGVSLGMTPEQRDRSEMLEGKRFIAVFGLLGLPTFVLSYLFTRGIRYYRDNLTAYNKQVGIGAAAVGLLIAAALIGSLGSWWLLVKIVVVIALLTALVLGILLAAGFAADYISGKRALARKRREDREAVYLAENGHLPTRKPSEPTALEVLLGQIFSGIGDFIVLIAQVVRVKKWGICPLVELDDEDRAAA